MSSTSSDTCYGTRNSCPSTPITSCTHSDVTIECSKIFLRVDIFSIFSLAYNASKANNTKITCGKIV